MVRLTSFDTFNLRRYNPRFLAFKMLDLTHKYDSACHPQQQGLAQFFVKSIEMDFRSEDARY